jgi:hypothetical protein
LPRIPRPYETECPECFGCGFVCGRCQNPVSFCSDLGRCDLDTEEMLPCGDCDATGILPADPPKTNTGYWNA